MKKSKFYRIASTLATCGQWTSTLLLVKVFYNLKMVIFKTNLEIISQNSLSSTLSSNKVYFNSHLSVQNLCTFYFSNGCVSIQTHFYPHLSVQINLGPKMWLSRKSYWTPMSQTLEFWNCQKICKKENFITWPANGCLDEFPPKVTLSVKLQKNGRNFS